MKFVQLVLLLAIAISRASCLRGKIVGGIEIDVGEARYQASVRQDDKHICGGAIITVAHVITSAHCKLENFHFLCFQKV